MRAFGVILPTLVLLAGQALGQAPTKSAPSSATSPPPAAENETEDTWSFSASVYVYSVPDDDDYAQPTVSADHGWLHLEARYNYEDMDTGSAWVGYNFAGGKELAWEFTPMLGGVFGDTAGIAPGYRGSLTWRKLELYSEGEYVFDTGHSSNNFLYNWSELTLAPVDWFRFGLVTQRTRAYETDRDIQRGVLAGVSFRRLDLRAYVLNPDESKPTVVISVGLSL